MGKKNLPNGFWTDFDGLIKIYQDDFEIAKKMDNTTNEIDFINVHVLPQFEKHLKKDGGFPMQKLADKKMVDYLQKRVIELQEIEGNRIYFLKGGKRQMSGYDWITEIEKARGEKIISDSILPTHNFEMLKAHRLKNVFEPEKAKLIEENKINKIGTDDTDVRLLYIQWLKDELLTIDNWIERINKLSTKVLYKADIIQIEKYRLFVNDEISKPEIANSLRSSERKKSISLTPLQKENLKNVLDKLHSADLISKEVKVPAFKKVFISESINDKIEWIGSIAALRFFIGEVCRVTNYKGDKWAFTLNSFFIKDKPLIKQILQNNKQVGSKDRENIKKAITHLQNTTNK